MNIKTYKAIKSSRNVHYIDIENVCGSGELTASMVAEARQRYFTQIQPGKDDLFFVAASHHNMIAVCFGWPGAHHQFRSGKDGADIELASDIVYEHPQDLYRSAYVASGDGGLAPFVAYLVQHSLPVTVVIGVGCASSEFLQTGASIVQLRREVDLAA